MVLVVLVSMANTPLLSLCVTPPRGPYTKSECGPYKNDRDIRHPVAPSRVRNVCTVYGPYSRTKKHGPHLYTVMRSKQDIPRHIIPPKHFIFEKMVTLRRCELIKRRIHF